jgi:alpha-tubulin suppressor-like RCC1 family protein
MSGGRVGLRWLLSVLITASAACEDPLLPDSTRHYRDVTTGGAHTCALDESGAAYCWGRGLDGELGHGRKENSAVPVRVVGDLAFRSISAGEAHTCAVATDDRVFCWGWNAFYQRGNPNAVDETVPNPVDSEVRFTQVSAGAYHTCAVALDSVVYCWGFNRWGQAGNGTTNTTVWPTPVVGNLRAVQVSSGGSHTCAVSTSQVVYCWGANEFGQLGIGSASLSVSVPSVVLITVAFIAVDAGTSHTCAVAHSRVGFCWGSNVDGEVGDGVPFRPGLAGPSAPTPVRFLPRLQSISAGHRNSCAIDQTGLGWCWGWNDSGQLGIGSLQSSAFPNPILLFPHRQSTGDLLAFTTLAPGGSSHACGVADGSVFCWGTGRNGELGNRARSFATQPQRVPD